MSNALDWLCYWIVMAIPLHRFDVRSRFIQFVLPRAGRHAHRAPR